MAKNLQLLPGNVFHKVVFLYIGTDGGVIEAEQVIVVKVAVAFHAEVGLLAFALVKAFLGKEHGCNDRILQRLFPVHADGILVIQVDIKLFHGPGTE